MRKVSGREGEREYIHCNKLYSTCIYIPHTVCTMVMGTGSTDHPIVMECAL